MYNLLTIGDVVIDTHVQIDDCPEATCLLNTNKMQLCLEYGAKIPIVHSFQSIGGNAANVAVGGAMLGLKTAVLTTLGGDANGKMALEALEKHDVDTSLVTFDAKATTRYSIVLNYQKERTILSYSDKKNYRWPKVMPEVDWVYYTGLSEGYETVQSKLIDYLNKHPNVKLAVNPGSYILKYATDALREVITQTDLLIVNVEEAEKIAGTTLAAEKSIAGLVHKLITMGPQEIVITNGAEGAWAGTMDEVYSMPSYPVEVVSKTGAGDAFSSGYLAARMRGRDISHALVSGTANSSGVVQSHGALAGLLTEKTLVQFTKKYPAVQPVMVV